MNYEPWNGPPELKPSDWPVRQLTDAPPFNGPVEFRPADWNRSLSTRLIETLRMQGFLPNASRK